MRFSRTLKALLLVIAAVALADEPSVRAQDKKDAPKAEKQAPKAEAPARAPSRPIPLKRPRRSTIRLQEEGSESSAPSEAPAVQPPDAPNAETGMPIAPPGSPPTVIPGVTPGAPPAAPPDTKAPELPRFETGIDFKPTPPGQKITFNLEDAELTDLVRLISSITGKAFILPQKSRSVKATIYAPNKVTAAEAYRAFLSILELNGLALVPSGRYLKIVESQGVEAKTIPLLIDENVPEEDRFVTHLYRVNHVAAEDVANLLGRFKSAEGNVTAYAPTNTLIITDTGTNIRRMLRIVGAIDLERGGEQLWIEPIHYANASELAQRLTEIFPVEDASSASKAPARPSRSSRKNANAPPPPTPGGMPGVPEASTIGTRAAGFRVTNILPDERTNSLIIIATEGAYLRILELIRHLDVPLDGDGGIHVHYLQHGDAEEISKTLSTLVGSAGKASAGGKGAAGGANNPSSDAVFEGQIAITAHKPTNSLVITSSLHDYAALKRVIDRLDSEQRQVFIEAVVVNLDVSNSSTFGLGYHTGIPNFPTDGSVGVLGYNGTGGLASGAAGIIGGVTAAGNGSSDALSGLAVGLQGPQIQGGPPGLSIPSFGVALSAFASSGQADLLATPHLLALNNEEAEINIGANVPLQQNQVGLGSLLGAGGLGGATGATGQAGQAASAAAGLGALGGLGGLGALGGLGGGVPRGDVGTRIRITPHINESDEIRLEIEEEISDVGAPVGNVAAVPINRRTAKTQVVVRDQQTVVIGGLMRDAITKSQKKVPLLGDIPLIGALFRTSSTSKSKQNLLLFLTPYVVRTQADLRTIYERKLRERQEFLDRFFVFGTHEYKPAVDYSRTRGLVSEIMTQMKVVANDRVLAAELADQPPPDHVPRPAIGTFGAREAAPGGEGGGEVIIEGGEMSGGGEAPAEPVPPPEPSPEP